MLLRLLSENTSPTNRTVRKSTLGAKLKELLPQYNNKTGVTMASLERELVKKHLIFKEGFGGSLSLGLNFKASQERMPPQYSQRWLEQQNESARKPMDNRIVRVKKKLQKTTKLGKKMTFVEPERTSGTVDDFASAGANVAASTMAPLYSDQPPVPQHVADKLNDDFAKFFFLHTTAEEGAPQTPALVDTEHRSDIADSGLFGACMHVQLGKHPVSDSINTVKMKAIANGNVYLNVHSPFCAVITGVQGSGKSHTMAVMLENCLLPCPLPPASPLVELRQPLSALVLHYDRVDTNICEATGLAHPSLLMEQWIAGAGGGTVNLPAPPTIKKIVVLVSPTFYTQRRAFYANDKRYDVRPLLFRWSSLDAVTLKKLMRIDEFGTQVIHFQGGAG